MICVCMELWTHPIRPLLLSLQRQIEDYQMMFGDWTKKEM